MAIKEVILIIATILNLIVGLFVYLRNRKSKINISYSLLSLGLAGWAFTNAIFQITPSLENALFWAKLSDISTILLVSSLFYFSLIFPKSILISQKYQYYLLYFFTFLVTIISLPNFNFVRKEVIFQNHIQKQIIIESGFYIFVFYILLFLIWTVINLKEKYKISKGDIKFQLQYVFTGIAIDIFCGTTFNLILPLMGNYSLVWLGPISTLISLVFIALAITRYHLFEIRVILTELLVGLMGIILLVQILLAPTFTWRISTLATFLLFCVFSYYLIKATHEESKRREEAEKVAIQERALRKKTERLVSAREQFLLSAQHYFRTPLTALIGYLEMILSGSYGKEKLALVLKSAQELRKRIEESLNISQFQLKKAFWKKKKFRLRI